jgi:hypothetical protein
VCKDDWGLDVTRPEQDECTVIVCDLMGLAREVPSKDRMDQQSTWKRVERWHSETYQVTLCFWPEVQTVPL